MNPINILTSSFRLLFRNAGSIALLCVPLLVVEMFIRNIGRGQLSSGNDLAWQAIIGTVIPPLYTGLLLLILDARSRDAPVATGDFLSKVLRLWPALAVLSALDQLLIVVVDMSLIAADTWLNIIPSTVQVIPPVIGATLRWGVFFLALWMMMRLMFNQCLVLLRGLSIAAAIRESFILSRGQLWQVVGCLALVLTPVLLVIVVISSLQPHWLGFLMIAFDLDNPGSAAANSIVAGFIRLFTTIVVFRFFTVVAERPVNKE
ncbi:hypothetical protein NLO95_20210 [Pseudomonas syringae]|nr:hypothetical protein [Pseudomonas syringae]